MKGTFNTRRRLLLLAVMIGFMAHAIGARPGLAQETHLAGMLNLAFGASKTEARQSILLHDGMRFDPVHSDAENLVYDGGVFAGHAVGFWVLGFVDDQMHTSKAIVQPAPDRLLATYHDLLAAFTDTYGEPTLQTTYFDDPYEHGDGFEIHAITFGKGHFAALWKFSDGDDENAISLSIDKDLYIPIVFQSGRLIDLAITKHESTSTSGL